MPAEEIPNSLTINPVISPSAICIIDSGINSSNGIFDKLVLHRIKNYLPKDSIDCSYDHGTFVASRCLFGDNIDDCLGSHSLQPYCNVIDIPVFGVNSSGVNTYPTDFGLRKAVEDVVTQFYATVKVYNLSLGVPLPMFFFVLYSSNLSLNIFSEKSISLYSKNLKINSTFSITDWISLFEAL